MKGCKRLLAVLLISVMLGGMAVTANAAVHVHAYSWNEENYYNSYSGIAHQYVTGQKTSPTGQVTYIYGTCQTVVYEGRSVWKCGCRDILRFEYYQNMQHMNCGISWE